MADGNEPESHGLTYIHNPGEDLEFPFVIVPHGSQIFEDVTAKVPSFILEHVEDAEHLPFLLKLAENLTVNILMGVEIEQQDIQTFSYQGCLQSILEIQKRIHNHLGMTKTISVGTSCEGTSREGTSRELVNGQDKAVSCYLLEQPQFTRSGRRVKRKESLSYLYNENDSDSCFVISAKTKTSNNDKTKETTDKQKRKPHLCKEKEVKQRKETNHKEKVAEDKETEHNEIGTEHGEKEVQEGQQVHVKILDNVGKEIKTETETLMNNDNDEEMIQDIENEEIHRKGVGIYRKNMDKDSLIGFVLPRMADKCDVDLEEMKTLLQKTNNPTDRKRFQKLYYELKTPYRFKCDLCSFKSKRESHYTKHVNLHKTSNRKIYNCELCQFKTIRAAKMTAHIEEHTKEKQMDEESKLNLKQTYVCSICGIATGRTKKNLINHWIEFHGDGEYSQSNNIFDCHLCDYTTNSSNRLKRHMVCHESLNNPKSYTNQYDCLVPGCSYTTAKKSLYTMHVRDTHDTQRFLCDLCGNSFKRKYCLQIHRKFVHPLNGKIPLSYTCDVCGKKFRSLSHKKEHQLTHSNKRSFLCETCGMAFKTKSSVRRHTSTVHNDIKKFSCKYCKKKFNTHTSRDRHEKTLNGRCAPIDNVKPWQNKTSKIEKVEPVPWQENSTEEQKIETQILLQILPAIPTAVQHEEQQHATLGEQDINIGAESKLIKNGTDDFGPLNETPSNINGNQVVVLGNGLNTDLTTESVVIGTVPVVMETVESQPAQVLNADGEVIWSVHV